MYGDGTYSDSPEKLAAQLKVLNFYHRRTL
jgi:hypothetical protein